jgi:hypothetical protein
MRPRRRKRQRDYPRLAMKTEISCPATGSESGAKLSLILFPSQQELSPLPAICGHSFPRTFLTRKSAGQCPDVKASDNRACFARREMPCLDVASSVHGSLSSSMRVEGSDLQSSAEILPHRSVMLGGLFGRRRCWVPTSFGWLVFTAICFSMALYGVPRLYPFLAVSKPIKAEVLIVEGWVNDAVIQDALNESQSHTYRKTVTTGGPIAPGSHLTRYGTWAQIAALSLRALGARADAVEAVPCANWRRNRTYESALAVRSWLRTQGASVSAVNVFTSGPHARRTRLLYERALGRGVKVGIIAAQSPEYEPRHWWRFTRGVEDVMGETLAYLYARASLWSLK